MKLRMTISCTVMVLLLKSFSVCTQPVYTPEDLSYYYELYQQNIDKDWKQAARFADKVRDATEVLFPNNKEQIATMTRKQANAHYLAKQYGQSRQIYQKAIELYEELYGQNERFAQLLVEASQAYLGKEKIKLLKQAVEITEEKHGDDSMLYAARLGELGEAMLHTRNSNKKAASYLSESYSLLLELLGEGHIRTSRSAFNLGKYELSRKRYSKAEMFFTAALKGAKDPDGKSIWFEQTIHGFLVRTYEEQGDSDKATEHCLAIGSMVPLVDNENYQPIYRVRPEYPNGAFNKGNYVSVLMEFDVTESGFVENIRVIDGSQNEPFKQASIKALSQWRYAPQYKDGLPVPTQGVRHKFAYRTR